MTEENCTVSMTGRASYRPSGYSFSGSDKELSSSDGSIPGLLRVLGLEVGLVTIGLENFRCW